MKRQNFYLTPHLSYNEVIKSETALRRGIHNEPNEEELQNLITLAQKVFEPLREYASKERGMDTPLVITSGFRSVELNKAIGGSATSDHCKGRAIDIDIDWMYGKEDLINADLFYIIEDYLSFDQLIWEFGTDENPAWIHVSYRSEAENRNQILQAVSQEGHTIYKPY